MTQSLFIADDTLAVFLFGEYGAGIVFIILLVTCVLGASCCGLSLWSLMYLIKKCRKIKRDRELRTVSPV